MSPSLTHLKLLMTIKDQHIHRLQLRHISMPLEFLPHLRPYGRHGHVEGVHRLNLRCLCVGPYQSAMIPLLLRAVLDEHIYATATPSSPKSSTQSTPPHIMCMYVPLSPNPDNCVKPSSSHQPMTPLSPQENVSHLPTQTTLQLSMDRYTYTTSSSAPNTSD